MIVIAVVVILVTASIIVVIIVIAIIFFIVSKYSNSRDLNVHGGGVSSTGDSGTLSKTTDIELTDHKRGTVIYEDIKHKESGLDSKLGGVYDRVNEIAASRYEIVGGGGGNSDEVAYSTVDDCADQISKLRHSEKKRKDGDYCKIDCKESLEGYSEVVQPSEVNNSIYSDPDVAYLPRVSLQPKVSAVPQAIQDSEYAVIGTTGAPEIPKKLDVLVDYLETKSFNMADKKREVSVSDGGSSGCDSDGGAQL